MTPPLGIIEGFFGRPWSWDERRAAVDFLAPHGFGFYLYAPKSDAYLRERWQESHPAGEMEALAEFGAHCRARGVRFGLGLSPFEIHLRGGDEWKEPLVAKLDMLAELKPDDLALLFDDMRGDVPGLAERQAAIVHFAAEHPVSDGLAFCPSYYSDDPILDIAFGPRPAGYIEELGRLLDPAIDIMWTGEEVCSHEIGVGHLERVATALRRKPFLWDNYPVNDGALMSQHLHLRAFTGRPAAIGGHLAAHGVNPASQPVLSRIPALTLAESYAAGGAYEYGSAWDGAAEAVLGHGLARRVRLDLLLLQDRGRDRLGDRLPLLRERYAAFEHPAAREIVAWLDGRWEVRESLVQTQ
ncbi:MAG TPA: beta-N-acetylglucosaminidase domain-containing protein [Allosphingosinicella sp.]|nr:beta-N-acetylglucosaminidase domain-containing protein [Allosphingosinicella sp.]HYG31071.1 beta-N-acetylglucosaminidase domain-containing protein [Allosphingosinicella sp.]